MSATELFSTMNMTLEFQVGSQNVVAVNNASVKVPEQKMTIIYGASGSGKSSLLNVLSGLQAPTKGSLLYRGTNLYAKTNNELAHFRAHELGIVYQTNYWVKSLSVLENVALPMYFLGSTKSEGHRLARQALERVDMSGYEAKSPGLLSGGEQQRIAMARAIVSNPPVIIADEPTGNLDSKNGDKIITLLRMLNEQEKKTIILVTHNMEYLSMAHHLLEIQDGKVSEISSADIPKTVKTMINDAQKRIIKLMETSR
jgi:putative ABC transport system ATP-binding protein